MGLKLNLVFQNRDQGYFSTKIIYKNPFKNCFSQFNVDVGTGTLYDKPVDPSVLKIEREIKRLQ